MYNFTKTVCKKSIKLSCVHSVLNNHSAFTRPKIVNETDSTLLTAQETYKTDVRTDNVECE